MSAQSGKIQVFGLSYIFSDVTVIEAILNNEFFRGRPIFKPSLIRARSKV
jgi:hypothetical protein